MKLVAWVCSRIKGGSESALILSVWLITIPACLYVLFLYLRPAAIEPPAPISRVERWIEPVSGYAFDRQGFALLAQKAPEFAAVQWQAASLPDVRPLPAVASGAAAPGSRRRGQVLHSKGQRRGQVLHSDISIQLAAITRPHGAAFTH